MRTQISARGLMHRSRPRSYCVVCEKKQLIVISTCKIDVAMDNLNQARFSVLETPLQEPGHGGTEFQVVLSYTIHQHVCVYLKHVYLRLISTTGYQIDRSTSHAERIMIHSLLRHGHIHTLRHRSPPFLPSSASCTDPAPIRQPTEKQSLPGDMRRRNRSDSSSS